MLTKISSAIVGISGEDIVCQVKRICFDEVPEENSGSYTLEFGHDSGIENSLTSIHTLALPTALGLSVK
jgi:hypothetical protein